MGDLFPRAVASAGVVKRRYVLKDGLMRFCTSEKRANEQAFGFERVKERLGDCVVVAAHALALADAERAEHRTEFLARVLTATIGMEDHARREHSAT